VGHSELGSESSAFDFLDFLSHWMLKQVQHDFLQKVLDNAKMLQSKDK